MLTATPRGRIQSTCLVYRLSQLCQHYTTIFLMNSSSSFNIVDSLCPGSIIKSLDKDKYTSNL